jgi:putative DNA primase/helicase
MLAQAVNNTLTSEWCAKFRSRTYGLIPTIRANAATLSKVAGEIIGNQRAGDQIGTLLAGAYAVLHDDRVSLDDARSWVSGFDWVEQTDERADSDETALLSEIMHAQIRLDTQHGIKTRSIAELVQFLQDGNDPEIINANAEGGLTRHGIRVKDGQVYVSESHPELRKMLAGSAWGGGWARILERVEGAKKHGSVRFAGVVHRAVSVPITAILGR